MKLHNIYSQFLMSKPKNYVNSLMKHHQVRSITIFRMLLVLKNPSVTFPTNILIRPLKFNTQYSPLKTIIHNIPTLIPKFLISQRLQNSKHKISFLIQTIHRPIILNHPILIQFKKNKLKTKFPSLL